MPKEDLHRDVDLIRHSLAHLLAAAVLKKFPEAKLAIGPTIENGFYYDFLLPPAKDGSENRFTPDDLKEFEKAMRSLAAKGLPFASEPVTAAEAEKFFKDQPFKLELIEEFVKAGEKLTVYRTGDERSGGVVFTDLCRGGHVENTKEIPADAFKLEKIAGAYWRGDEKNPMLQRIYGLAFGSRKELDDYLKLQEEAKKRDHRKLGKDLGLFAIVDEVGPGLPLFYPKGAILRRTLENYITEVQETRGYVPIWVPHITKAELYKISGHLDKYDAMYPPMDLAGEAKYYLKPMNCPHFMMLYRTEPHSYRELPLRWTATTTVYRHEKSGELSGLTRVRALTQDDCHVFAREDQIEQEINLMLDMVKVIYGDFGFGDFRVSISVRDSKHSEKYIGSHSVWEKSESTLERLIAKRGWKYAVYEGEAAFYGPKLDFIFKDALGRDWQLTTIQLDMNLPERFGLEYTDDKGNKARPIVIHRALLGSTERFMGIIIEHFAGAFPLWLAPIQAAILPISDKFDKYGEKVANELKASGMRVELAAATESLGKRIRAAELQKIPYILVVGEKEEAEGTVAVRSRKGDEGPSKIEEFAEKMRGEIASKKL